MAQYIPPKKDQRAFSTKGNFRRDKALDDMVDSLKEELVETFNDAVRQQARDILVDAKRYAPELSGSLIASGRVVRGKMISDKPKLYEWQIVFGYALQEVNADDFSSEKDYEAAKSAAERKAVRYAINQERGYHRRGGKIIRYRRYTTKSGVDQALVGRKFLYRAKKRHEPIIQSNLRKGVLKRMEKKGKKL